MNKVDIRSAKQLAKANSALGRAPKRPNNDVNPHNTTAKEMAAMSSQMDELTEGVKTIRENLSNPRQKGPRQANVD